MKKSSIESPCISICRYEDEVCVGCGRTVNEVVGWYDMTDDEKLAVLSRLDEKNRGSFSDWI
jgi:predicted Fe-S protein YdhL (DUF1289 family)